MERSRLVVTGVESSALVGDSARSDHEDSVEEVTLVEGLCGRQGSGLVGCKPVCAVE